MKKIILGLTLILSLQSFAQGDFREMSWGDSVSQLKSMNPNTEWQLEKYDGKTVYATESYVGGLEVSIAYIFLKDKLIIGGYFFKEIHSSDNKFYEDFKKISGILNKKYDMEREEKWNDTTWKENPNYIGHALSSGDVEINETYENEKTFILHSIDTDDYRGIEHVLVYRDNVYFSSISETDGF